MSDSSDRQPLDSTRRKLLAALGGSASVGLAGCSALFGDDDDDGSDDDGSDDGGSDDGGSDDGGSDDDGGENGNGEPESYADKAQAAWERVVNNPEPENEDIRTEAYIEIEEAVRDDAIMLPFLHGLSEFFWYDYVDVPTPGTLGRHHLVHNRTTVENDTELNLINATHDHVDPVMSDDTASSEAINQIYETLARYPGGVPELETVLIEDFELSDDGTTYTFSLKEGVQFHDGTEMTASDVKYSFRRLLESPNSVRATFVTSSPNGLGLVHETNDDGEIVPDSGAIEVVDDYTLEIEIRNPNPDVLDVLTYNAFAVIPEGYVGDIEGYEGEVSHEEFRTQEARGTGPFELDTFSVGEELRVTRNDDYHGTVASVESVHWNIVEEASPRWTYAMEQNADFFEIPTQNYDSSLIDAEQDDRGRDVGTYGPVENDETLNYVAVPELSTFYFAFNAQNVQSRAVRRAFAYVIDQEEMVNEVFQGRGATAFSFTPPGLWPTGADGYEQWVDEYPYSANETDIPSATEALEEAGYTEDDPYELTLTTYVSPTYTQAAELLQSKLAGNGVNVNLDEAQFATLQQRGFDGDLELYTLGWIWSWESVAYGHFGFEPKNTDTSRMPGETNGYYLDWQVGLDEEA